MVGPTQGGCFARAESKRHVDIWPQELSGVTEGLKDTQRLGLNAELEDEIYSDMWGCKGSSRSILVQQQSAPTWSTHIITELRQISIPRQSQSRSSMCRSSLHLQLGPQH